jgi:tetratricopeptide (TPR) repeat protein
VTITWQSTGYRLTVDEATIDLHHFRDLVEQASTSPGDEAAARWDEALALWRGEPFVGVNLPWFVRLRASLLAERNAALLDRTDVMLKLGRHDAVLPALAMQTQEHPLDERLAGQLMLALHRAGRTADALAHYDQVRERLIDDLGADPSIPLRQAYQQLVATDLTPTKPSSPIPRQLPAVPGSFTGRSAELATLTRILDTATETGRTVVISAVAGTGGIGKTWLSLYWARQQCDRFPDGQIFVDLRGFSPESQPMPPATAVRGFLDALGVDDREIPASLAAQSALWRTLVADKRMLIVLDNAANAEQVVPLLPGGSTNTVLVNSRDHLSGLITGHGAHPVAVDILSDADARDLLITRLGPTRVTAEPDAVDELLAYCAGFPLALSIVVGQALSHPDFPLAMITAELRDNRLASLDDDDPAASLPSVLSWSYAALTEEQARAFGLLGIAPGADISITAASSLLDRSPRETRALLRALHRASLLRQDFPDRYTMHDLVRAYARENSGADAEPALRRLVDFYLHTGCAANTLIKPSRPTITLPAVTAGTHPCTFSGIHDAMRWFTEEHQNLFAAHDEMVARKWHELTWQLTWILTTYRERTGRLMEELAAWQSTLASVLILKDPAVEALARQHLGDAYARVELFEEAHAELDVAIRIAADIGDLTIEAFSERNHGRAYDLEDRWAEANPRDKRALELFKQTGNPAWIAGGLNNVGFSSAHLGDHEYAKSCCEQALETYRQHYPEDHSVIGHFLDSLGYIANQMNRYDDAISYYEQARAEYAITNDIYFDADALELLGDTYLKVGQLDKAREYLEQAWQHFHDHKRHTAAQRVQAQLDGLTS